VPALLKDSLAEGLAFSEALERIPTIIDPVISMYIRSAEETGNLTHAMQEVSTRILAGRKWDQMVSEILFYPRLVLVAVTLILDAFWLFFLPFMRVSFILWEGGSVLDRIGEPVQVFYVGTSPYKHWKRLGSI